MKNENTQIVKQYIENVLNTGNAEDLPMFISPHYTELVKDRKYHLGINGMREKIAGIREIYPDLKLSIDLQFTEGDWVVTSYIMNATQVGNGMGISATGKTVEVRGVEIDKVVDGKITEHESSADFLDPLIENSQHSIRWVTRSLEKIAAKYNNIPTICETAGA